MQNPYNNYLKRQKQQPINNFKEKVKNSLNGKVVNNTTMPNTTKSIIQNKVRAMTPNKSTSTIGSGSASGVVTPINKINNTNASTTTLNALETPLNASEVPSVTPNVAPVENTPQVESGAGLMSLSEINNSIPTARTTTNPNARTNVVYNPLNPNAIVPGTGGMTQAEYEAEVKRKQEAGIALDNQELYNKYMNSATPYKYAEQILQNQKEQADKAWQLQQDMFNQQQQSLKDQYNQSVKDAENAYNKSVDTLNEQRYNQMEELNVSGTNRGIQYSPQQLGLENVANINHNKNLAEASNSRNELLNKLQIEMNNSLAQLNMGHLQAYNDYQKNILDYQTSYYDKLMNWNREDSETQSNRDWEKEMQELKNKFEKEMQDAQNKFDKEMQDSQNNWQSNENALDRTHETNLNKSRSSSGYSYSKGYTPYSSNYTPYSRSYYNGYDNSSSVDDEITQQAIDNRFKQLSTDAYNASDMGYVNDLMERAGIYDELISPMYDEYYGKNKTVDERLDNTRETALKHLLNKSIARSTNGAYNIGDTVYQELRPLRQSYIDKVNNNKNNLASRYYDRFSKNEGLKTMSKYKARIENSRNIMKDIDIRERAKKEVNKKEPTKKENKTSKSAVVKKVEKSIKNSTKNAKTSVKNSVKNVKKSTSNASKNTKKSTSNAVKNVKKNLNTKASSKKTQKAISNSKKNVKKSSNNALKNLKKNISKMFKKKKK